MRLLSVILVPLGLVVELIAACVFLAHWGGEAWLWIALLAHGVAACLLVAGLYLALPTIYRAPRAGALAFVASSVVLIPVLGAFGLATAMLAGLYWAYREKPREWDLLEIPDLPFQPVEVDPSDVFMRDGLSSVLAHFDDRNRRQRAIMACRHLPNRQAVPILRMGLGDSADEVRLLAYAMLNSIERDLESQVSTVRDTIDAVGDPDGQLHEELGALYWEFSYLQLARGSVEAVLLGKAIQSLDTALKREKTPQRWLLRARICLALDSFDAAEDALTKADALGLSVDDSAPRWAELAFSRGRYAEIAPWLKRMSPEASNNPVMRPVLEYWL